MSHPPPYAWDKKLQTMHSTEAINQFLNLRAQGWSFARIADQLQVSKPTLLDWNRKHQIKLESMKAEIKCAEQQTVRASHEEQLQHLTLLHTALRQELIGRTLQNMSNEEIEALSSVIERQIENLSGKEK
jgi:predicted DNA-binding protein YlxM (UPF0122 family)